MWPNHAVKEPAGKAFKLRQRLKNLAEYGVKNVPNLIAHVAEPLFLSLNPIVL